MSKHQRGVLKGPKCNRSHSTYIVEARSAIEAAKLCPHVTKVSLGLITSVTACEPRLKFTVVTGGLKMQVRGRTAVQLIWVYTTNAQETIKFIKPRWAV